jgi:hypothetical protein
VLHPNIIHIAVAPRNFTPPSIEEVLFQARQIGLSENEAQKFFYYYESQGWFVGKAKMKVWRSALAGWKLRCVDAQKPNGTAQNITWRLELDRIEKRLSSIRGSYSEHQSWDLRDKNLFACLKKRRDELVRNLGMSI